jgi:hypothetical protein
LISLAVLAPRATHAQSAERIAVLPLVANDASLEIYSSPVAREVGKHLRETLAIEVRDLADAASVPAAIDLVIDGRINRIDAESITLEAKVRDAAISRIVSVVTSGERPLVDIDAAAKELATRLAPIIRDWRREQPEDPYRLESAVRDRPAEPDNAAPVEPYLVVLRATGTAADGVIPVQAQARQAVFAFARRLGVRSIAASDQAGDVDRVKVANVVRSSHARYGLTIRIEKVRYDFRGVLSARGKARIRLIDRNGGLLFETVVGTDTVVGARGDRHSALVYMVAEQALDIAGPRLRKALEL